MQSNQEETMHGWVKMLMDAGVKLSIMNAMSIRLRAILSNVQPGQHMPDEVFNVFEEALHRPLTNQERLDIRDGFDRNWKQALNIFDKMHE